MIAYIIRATLISLIICSGFKGTTQQFLANNPYIINYNKQQYGGGTENWDISSTQDGYLYVANNEGLLRYDGKGWDLYKLPNKTIVRSLAVDLSCDRIYVGGQDEIGFFYPSTNGTLIYKSLKNKLPQNFKLLEDVWNLQLVGNQVFFRSVNTIFFYDHDTIKVVPTASKNINIIKNINNTIYFSDPDKGIFTFDRKKVSFLGGSEIIKKAYVSDIISTDGEILFITEKNGIYVYDGQNFKLFTDDISLHNSILTDAAVVNKQLIAVSTVLSGIHFFNHEGKYLFSISKKQGLQTNNIISLTIDSNGSLWAGSANGIDQILINSPYNIIYPDLELQGSVFAVKSFHNRLFVGTNHGLYYTDWEENSENYKSREFFRVKNSSGQVWALDIINDDLMMSHNEGLFIIKENIAIKIQNNTQGTWRCLDIPIENMMLAGTYEGFQLFKKDKENWTFVKNINGFKESARIVAVGNENYIWVSHPYRGVYKLTFDESFEHIKYIKSYSKENGLNSSLSNYISQLNSQIYVNSEAGIFVYSEQNDKFETEKYLKEYLGNSKNIRRFFQDNKSFLWYAGDDDCGVLLVDDKTVSKTVTKVSTPFLTGKLLGGFENIYMSDDRYAFAGTDKGLILIDLNKLLKHDSIFIRFDKITIKNKENDIVYGGYVPLKDISHKFLHSENNLKISFGTNLLDKTNIVHYKYKLSKQDKEWSVWSDQNEIQLSNLSPNNYEFQVKARTNNGIESNIISYKFTIKPPWYLTILAKIIYFIIFILMFYALTKYLDKKHLDEKNRLKNDKEYADAKVELLLNEKLQAEIEFKNKELALSTMHLVQKNEALGKLREELNIITSESIDQETKSQIKKVVSILSDDQRLEDDWENFAIHFDQVHTDFLRRLKAQYPNLSPKDLKLCAYLRMNMTTKDIAPLLNISVRGVEISRYRLRKKMDIDPNFNLNDFMMNF